MSEYTPGPWHSTGRMVGASDRVRVADCNLLERTPEEARANARLIAAAPQLLTALISAREALRVAVRANVDIDDFDVDDHVVIRRINFAIAKARGET